MSLKQSIKAQERADKMRSYIKSQIRLRCWIVVDEYPKWSIGYGDDIADGSWNYNMIENAIAYKELKQTILSN